MGPPSYKALSVEYTPWTHTPGIRVLPPRRAPPRASQQNPCPPSGANRQRNCTARTLVPCSRGRQAGSARPRVHTAPLPHSPARSRGLTRYIDLPAGAQLWAALRSGTPSPSHDPHTPAPAGQPTARIPRHESHTARYDIPAAHTSPMQGHPAHTHTMHTQRQVGTAACHTSSQTEATCVSSADKPDSWGGDSPTTANASWQLATQGCSLTVPPLTLHARGSDEVPAAAPTTVARAPYESALASTHTVTDGRSGGPSVPTHKVSPQHTPQLPLCNRPPRRQPAAAVDQHGRLPPLHSIDRD